MIAWVDGVWVELDVRGGPQALLAVLDGRTGPGVFETMGARAGRLPLWSRHLARMERGARRLGIAWEPDAQRLRDGVLETLHRNEQRDGVLRLTLVPMAPSGARWLAVARRRTGSRNPLRLLPIDDLEEPHGPPRDIKCTSRDLYDRALARAAAAKADDALLLSPDGEVLETAVGNVLFWEAGQWVTPAVDGRFLPGIGREVILDGLRDAGTPAVEQPCSLERVARSPQVVVTNAVHGPRRAVLGGRDDDAPRAAAAPEPGPAGAFAGLRTIWERALER